MGIGALTGIGIQKSIEAANTLSLTATVLTNTAKNLYLPSFYGRLSFDVQGRIVMSPELVIQMQDGNGYSLITPYSVGGTPIIPIPTWEDRKINNLSFSTSGEKVITTLASITIFAMIGMIGFIIWFRNTKLIRGSTPLFCCLILIGGIIFVSSVWMWPYQGATDTGCKAFNWLLHLGFTLMIQSMVIKTFRLWRIFTREELTTVKITINDIIVGLSIVILIDIIFLVLWSLISPITTREVIVDPDRISLNYTTCSSGSSNFIFEMISIGYHSASLLLMMYISWNVRNIPDNFNETIYIAVGFYFGSFIIALVLGILLSSSTNNLGDYLVRSLGIIFITIFTIAPLFWSKVRGVAQELYGINSRVTRIQQVQPVSKGKSEANDSSNKIKIMANSIVIDTKRTITIVQPNRVSTPRKATDQG
ncbi:MAG: hypothetical protein Solumvirus9_2 [Solumvirus sp.]|uniref:G-protein coupled receptors family 3 profile domain-containing protein n=1 Tax=Solumvirus sp. TaxID=2487773 RepID=A0A3G5AGU0_9VIRU|nr:MAG: hypothetical protein Solumvirus9_2 [Solumvirus sp.]